MLINTLQHWPINEFPSPGQQSTLLSIGITQPEFEENKFTLYNPDNALLDIAVETTDVPSNDVQVDPAYIDGQTTQQDVKVVIPQQFLQQVFRYTIISPTLNLYKVLI